MGRVVKENEAKKFESQIFQEKLYERLKIEEEKEKKRLEKEAKRREALEKYKLKSIMEQATLLSGDKSTFKNMTVLKKSKFPSRDDGEECGIALGGDASNFLVTTRKCYDDSSNDELIGTSNDKSHQQEKLAIAKKTLITSKQEYFPPGTFYLKNKHSDQKTTNQCTKKNQNNSRTSGKKKSKFASTSNESKSQQAVVWDFPERHFPKLGVEAPIPSVNPWEARQAKSEEISAMLPHDENEEEAMMRQALELSKLQALEEEKQRQLNEEYELQNLLLLSNPELGKEFGLNDECDFTTGVTTALCKNSPNEEEEFLDNNKTIQNEKSSSKQLLISNPEHFCPNSKYDSTPFNNRSIPEITATVYKNSTANKEEFVESKKIQHKKSSSNEQKNPVVFKGAKPKLSKIIDSFGGWGLKEVNQSTKFSNTTYSCDDKLSEKPLNFNSVKENSDVIKEISHYSGQTNYEQFSNSLLNSKKHSRVENLVTCQQAGSKSNSSEAHVNKSKFANLDEKSEKQIMTNRKNISCNNVNNDRTKIVENDEHFVSFKVVPTQCDEDLNAVDRSCSKKLDGKIYIGTENKSYLPENIPLLDTCPAVSIDEADEVPLFLKSENSFRDKNSKSSSVCKELLFEGKSVNSDQTSYNSIQYTSMSSRKKLLPVSSSSAVNKEFVSCSVMPSLKEVYTDEIKQTSEPNSFTQDKLISNQEETYFAVKNNISHFPTIPNSISSLKHETPNGLSYSASSLPETADSCDTSGVDPALMQTHLLNNSLFMKQWQTLNSFYKLLSVRNSLPFYLQQMAFPNNEENFNNAASSVPEQALFSNPTPCANTPSGTQHINHSMSSSFKQNNEEKASTYLAPPGIDVSFIQPEPSLDNSQLGDENPVWKEFLSGYDETVIPPPKPLTSVYNVPEDFRIHKPYSHTANNFNSESKLESDFKIAQNYSACESVGEKFNTVSMSNTNHQVKNGIVHINGNQPRNTQNHSLRSHLMFVEPESSGWSDPEDDLDVNTSKGFPRHVIPWDNVVDGWESECCPALSAKSLSHYENKRPPNRQPISETYLERFNGQRKSYR